jgi:uncharacterized caspase-like protein
MRLLILAISVIGILLSSNVAKADRRVAFVVGNGAYTNVRALPNPPSDAKAIAGLLRNVGFDVVEGADLTRAQMTEKLLDFGKRAAGADLALFFYAGHGIAINGTNYLLPVDADIKSEADVKLGSAINLDITLDQTMGDAKVKLVFLDACRGNSFAATLHSLKSASTRVESGLTEMKTGEGTLLAYSTIPGKTALDGPPGVASPFTHALLANIAKPGVEIQEAMTKVRAQVYEETNRGQLPWGPVDLIAPVYLDPSATRATPAMSAATTSLGSDAEIEFWRSVKDTNQPEELKAYLTAYPLGRFKAIALTRMAALQGNPNVTTCNDQDSSRAQPNRSRDPHR